MRACPCSRLTRPPPKNGTGGILVIGRGGDWVSLEGTSTKVTSELAYRLPATMEMILGALLIGVFFWLALILIYAFAVNMRILPPSGRLDVLFSR